MRKDTIIQIVTPGELDALEQSRAWQALCIYARAKISDEVNTTLMAVRTAETSEAIGLIAKYHTGKADGILYVVERLIKNLREALTEEEKKNAKQA